jgi:hypothetical protein
VTRCPAHADRTRLDCPRCEVTRRHDAWSQWVGSLRPWDAMANLTFDPKRRPVVPPGAQRTAGSGGRLKWPVRLTEGGAELGAPMAGDVARRKVRTWLRDAQAEIGRQLVAVGAMEHHKNGWPHFHMLVGIDGGMRGGELTVLRQLWNARNGGNDIKPPRSVGDCAAYAAKYLTKDLDVGGVLIHPAAGPLSELRHWWVGR